MKKNNATLTRMKKKVLWYTAPAVFVLVLVLYAALFPNNLGSVLNLLASSSLSGASTTVYFTPYGDETLDAGSTTDIDININTRVPINALGATITFATDTLEVVGIDKEKSFLDLWTESTTIAEGAGLIHFSGGTTRKGGLVGEGTVLTLKVKAKGSGTATLTFKDVQVYPSDDTGAPIETLSRSITYTIEGTTAPALAGGSSGGPVGISSLPTPTAPSADLNGDGNVNLIDLSILMLKMISPYAPRFDINGDGKVGLADLAILLSKMPHR